MIRLSQRRVCAEIAKPLTKPLNTKPRVTGDCNVAPMPGDACGQGGTPPDLWQSLVETYSLRRLPRNDF